MALKYSPKIVTDGLVMCLDASNNKSYPTTDLPIKDGLVMWMDAADDTTFSYSSGTTVSQWRDKSPSGFHMVPKSAGPTRNTVLNSRKTLTFTTSQTIGNNTINLASSANSVFVVSRYNNSAGSLNRVLTCNLDASGNNWLLGHWGGYVNQYYAEGWVRYQVNAADTTWRIYMGDYSGLSTDLANLYSNGTSVVTNSNAASAGPNKLGINYYSGEPSDCEVAEIIVFNKVLSATERKLVHTYLGQKWGILNTDRSIIDLSGNVYSGLLGNGTSSNMPSLDYYNKGALKFNGTGSYVTTGVSGIVPTSTGTYTVSVWCYRNTNNSSYRELLAQWTYANSGNSFYFGFQNSDVRFTDNWNPITVTGAGNTNVWMNLVGVYTVSNAYIYLNGVLAATKGSGFTYTGTGPLIIGRQGELNSEYFDGNIGNVLIYNRALSAAEVTQNYEAQKSKFDNTIVQQGLVLNLDAGNPYSYAGAGTTWYDVSGNTINASATGTPTYSSLNSGTIYFYPSVSSYYNTSAVSALNLGSASFSMEAWVYLDAATGSDNVYRGIISLGVDGSNYVYIAKWRSGLYSGLYVQYIAGGSTITGVYQANDYNPVSRWTHVVATKSSNVLYLYVNGVLYSTASNLNTTFTGNSSLYVGQAHSGVASMYGYMGEARAYNISLSAAQVLQNYNATKGRFGL